MVSGFQLQKGGSISTAKRGVADPTEQFCWARTSQSRMHAHTCERERVCERECVRGRETECMCMRERESVCVTERDSVCVRERESECVCERERVCVWVGVGVGGG